MNGLDQGFPTSRQYCAARQVIYILILQVLEEFMK